MREKSEVNEIQTIMVKFTKRRGKAPLIYDIILRGREAGGRGEYSFEK